MHFNQKLSLGMLICLLVSSLGNAYAQTPPDENAADEHLNSSDKNFLNEIDRIYRDSRHVDTFAQLSKPWRPNPTVSGKSSFTKAKEAEDSGRYLAACADYLVGIRDTINSKGPVSISAPLESISQIIKKLDKDSQRMVCKSMIDVAIDSKRYSFAREHNKELVTILQLALAIKDALRDHDEQLVSVLMELAMLEAAEKNYQPAIDYYKRALALILETKPEDDGKLMSCVNGLSAIYSSQQNQNQTEIMLKNLISSLEAGQGDSSNSLARVPYLLRLYTVYKHAGKLTQAAQVADKVISIVEEYSFNPLLKSDSRLASSVAEQMKISSHGFGFNPSVQEDDERLQKCGFKFKLKVQGFGPWVAYDLASLGQMLSRAGKLDEAMALYKMSIATAEDLNDQQTAELLQQRLLSLLNNTPRQAEKAQLEAKLKQRKDQKNQDAYREAIHRLSESKGKGTSEQSSIIDALLSAASAALEVEKKSEARSYFDEAIVLLKKAPLPTGYQDSSLSQLWRVARSYLAHAENKEDEHVVYVVAELDEQRHASNNRSHYYSSMDLSTIIRYFLDKQKSLEAEDFVKYVIDLRKHYRPTDIESLLEAYYQLRMVYNFPNFQTTNKLTDTLSELVKLNEMKYGANNIRALNERTALALLLVRQNKPELVDKTLLPVLAHLHQLSVKGKERTVLETNEMNQLTPNLSQVADAYLISGNMPQAEKYTRQALEVALVDEYHTGLSSDRIVRNLLNAGQFLKASEFILLRLAVRERSFGANSFEVAQQRLQLSEVYFKYSRQLSMQGKKTIAKEWFDKSELAFKQALSAIESSQGADSVAAKDAIKKRELMLNPVQPDVQSGDDVT
ncbi:MAG: hypothetical protein K2X77_31100 [Candidatus Obscuribacterales bacterium]|nr:hypothetical protein [Candidatus Obscuribacterales bacterium]